MKLSHVNTFYIIQSSIYPRYLHLQRVMFCQLNQKQLNRSLARNNETGQNSKINYLSHEN